MPTISGSLSCETKYVRVNHAQTVALLVIRQLKRLKPNVIASYDYWIDLNTPFVKDAKYVAGVIIRTKKGSFKIPAHLITGVDALCWDEAEYKLLI